MLGERMAAEVKFSSEDHRPLISPQKVAVVGTGTLGTRIAGELALCGCTVRAHDSNPLNLQTVHSRISEQLQELRERELLPHHFHLQGSVIVEQFLSNAVSDVDLVLEAVVDSMETKISTLQDITSLCSASTILCSNTLNLSLVDMFQSIPCPERSLGLRFLFPVYLIDRVEMTPHTSTSPATIDQVKALLHCLGKTVFLREEGKTPMKLTEQQALQLQKMTLVTQPQI